jgi:hypothetical protein
MVCTFWFCTGIGRILCWWQVCTQSVTYSSAFAFSFIHNPFVPWCCLGHMAGMISYWHSSGDYLIL